MVSYFNEQFHTMLRKLNEIKIKNEASFVFTNVCFDLGLVISTEYLVNCEILSLFYSYPSEFFSNYTFETRYESNCRNIENDYVKLFSFLCEWEVKKTNICQCSLNCFCYGNSSLNENVM